MFDILNEIINIQTNKLQEVPTRLEKDRLKEYVGGGGGGEGGGGGRRRAGCQKAGFLTRPTNQPHPTHHPPARSASAQLRAAGRAV